MRKCFFLLLLAAITACEFSSQTTTHNPGDYQEVAVDSIEQTIKNWHRAAANANFEEYFDLMTRDGIFIGTDATENWQNHEFREFAKPYFDRGSAWDFQALERNIYTSKTGETAWFDELLDTHMGLCRGSGVLVKEEGEWKIKHYVLSITIPNDNIQEINQIKKEFDSTLISKYN